MIKILVIPYTHILSHISRPLLVAKELRNRGHEVVFAGAGPKIQFIEREEFQVLPLYETDPAVLLGNIRKSKIRFVSNDEINTLVESDLALYDKVKPDMVLSDFRFSSPISTHIAGIKHAAIVNASSTKYRTEPFVPFFDWIPNWLLSRRSHLWLTFNNLNLALEMSVFDNVMNIFKKLSRKYSASKLVTATTCLTGKDINLMPDIPEYFPTANLPSQYHYIGPLTWKSDQPTPTWWPPAGIRPFIYFTMGTTGLANVFQEVYELIKKSEMTAIITTGGQTSELKSVEGKIYVEPFLDGDMVMDMCDLVVCHGGNGTIYQALSHGKPVIGIPTVPDQLINMRRVEALGIGKKITWQRLIKEPSHLLAVIKAIMNNQSFYTNCARLKKNIVNYNAAQTGAEIIEEAMK